ncbi:MAG: hypothetical protein ABIO80_00770 [Sphingomicrobium sp.]
MAKTNSSSRGSSNRSGSHNHNPTGKNQYSGGMMDMARERPFAAAAAAAGAAAAGVFLWSRRNQISEWRDGSDWSSSDADHGATATATESFIARPQRARGGRKSQSQISEEAMTLKETGKVTA